MTSQEPSPGYAEFTLKGSPLRLEPVIEDGQLFFMFKDATSGRSTYAAGRFLYADMPKDGTVDLDFNKAKNPPCAFTAFATCPLPPKQNTLPVAIEAGEMKYGAALKLVLASRSPRRAELLAAAGIEFTVRPAEIDETPREGEDPMDYVLRLAEEKALAADCAPGEIVLAADTTVVLGGEILGKPVDRADAVRMLDALCGRKHEVITGVCLRDSERMVREAASTSVWFAPLTQAEIEEYVASGEPMDKAGAYGIQGLASRYIERVEGSYTNVVGLPVAMIYRMLQDWG